MSTTVIGEREREQGQVQVQDLSWYRGFIQGKTRITLAWIFALVLGFTARNYPALPGVLVCLLGATLRYWASGYLRKDIRPAVGGPYSFVRNPLYLGTYLMAVGVAWAIENYILLAIVSVAYVAIYHYIILDEEVKLRRIFHESYAEYIQHVPRFFPRLWPPFFPASRKVLESVNPELSHHRFSLKLANQNKAYEAYASFLGLVGFVVLVPFLWQYFGS